MVAQLYNASLQWNYNAWDSINQCGISGNQTATKFRLTLIQLRAWADLRQWLIRIGTYLLKQQSYRPQASKQYGAYLALGATKPSYLVKGNHIYFLRILVGQGSIDLTKDVVVFILRDSSQTLQPVLLVDGYISTLTSFFDKIRVITTTCSQ